VSTRRVVVTGLGALSPVGNTADEFWSSLLQGRSGVGPITKFDTDGYPTRIAGEVRNFDPLNFVDKKDARRLDPYLQYAVASSVLAVPRLLQDHPPWVRRRDDRRRVGGHHHPAHDRGLLLDEGHVHAQRRADEGHAALRRHP